MDPEGDDDILKIGPHARRPWRRWAPLTVLVIAGIVAAVIVSRHGDNARPSASSPSTARPSQAEAMPAVGPSPGEPAPTQWVPVPSAVHTDAAGKPILGITGDYELLARGPTTLVRVQFAAGRVIMTGLPGLASSGPVSFLVGAQRAIIRPLDLVPGYEVVDGGPIQTLGGLLSNGGLAMPGPDAEHLWIEQPDDSGGSTHSVLRLVDFAGRPGAESIRIDEGFQLIGSDGAGYVLLSRNGVLYDARPDGLTRIASGDLLATGPTGWLVSDCDRQAHCTSTYLDRRTGSHHRLRKDLGAFGPPTWGVISSDGATAAVLTNSTTHGPVVTLIDLRSGDEHAIPGLVLTTGPYTNQLAFSPDGRWLFMAGYALLALDVTSRSVHAIGDVVPSLSLTQLAVRPATGSRP